VRCVVDMLGELCRRGDSGFVLFIVGSDALAAAGSESAVGQSEMCLYNPSFALLRLFWQLAHKHVCCDWSADLLSYNRVLDVCSGKVCPFSGDVKKAKAGANDVCDRGSGL
jgi:hypothetical protein